MSAGGIEVLSIMISGDALTDGYLLSQALRERDRGPAVIAALHPLS